MGLRWMEGAGRLDTSRGSRFMRGEADLNPPETESNARSSEPAAAQSDPQSPGVEVAALSQRRQARANLRSAETLRNAG